MRLAELRKDAGLSQYELARYVGVPQPNIAFWEQSEKPPRRDVLSKMAEALGVSVEDLLIGETGKAASRKAIKSNGRPAGKVREVFDRVSKLPRRQQEHIVNRSPHTLSVRANHQSEPFIKFVPRSIKHPHKVGRQDSNPQSTTFVALTPCSSAALYFMRFN
jgi:transcriptional regulator with XRE-family HTH domain